MPAPSDVNLLRWRQHAQWKGNSTRLCFCTPITISQEYSLSTILGQVRNPIHPGLTVFADTGSCSTMTSSCIIPSFLLLKSQSSPVFNSLPLWSTTMDAQSALAQRPRMVTLPWSTVLPILKTLSRSLHNRAQLFYLNSSVSNLHVFLVNCGCQTLQ